MSCRRGKGTMSWDEAIYCRLVNGADGARGADAGAEVDAEAAKIVLS